MSTTPRTDAMIIENRDVHGQFGKQFADFAGELERESEGRRLALMQKSDEATREWNRAENAEGIAARRLALLIEVRVALLAAGWVEDGLMRRLRFEIAPTNHTER